MGYGAGGRYPEETDPSGGGMSRDESYPKGHSGGVRGTLSMHLPGKGGVVKPAGALHPRSAAHCADAMEPTSGSKDSLG